MRSVLPALCLIPSLALAPAMQAAEISPIKARSQVTPVSLREVLANPSGFEQQRISARCVFVERGALFNDMVSQFQPGRYQNIILWSDRQSLWEPEAREQALFTGYVHTQSNANQVMGTLAKYQYVDIVAKVVAVSNGEPWVEVETITPVADPVGAFTDQSVYHLQHGLALGKEGALDLADDHFQAALASDLPTYARAAATQMRVEHLVLAGRHAAALPLASSAMAMIDADTGSSAAQKSAIRVLMAKALIETSTPANRSQNLALSASHASDAVRLDPTRGEAFAVLGIALAGLDRFEEARRECDKAVRLRPNDAEVRWYLGRILDRQGHFDEAIEALRKAIDLTPKDHRMHRAMATAYAHRAAASGSSDTAAADFFTAIREYDITLRLNAKDVEAHVLAAEAILAASKIKAEIPDGGEKKVATRELAIARLDKALAIDAAYIPAHEMAILLYKDAGNTAKVEAHLSRLIEIEPNSVERAVALADYRLSMSKQNEAFAGLKTWAAAHPKRTDVLLHLATRQIAARDDVGALASLEAIVAIDGGREVRDTLASVKERLANVAKAAADKAKRDQEDKDKAEKEKAEKMKADKEKADKEKADKMKADKEKADKEKADKDKADKEKAEKMKADKEKADKEKASTPTPVTPKK